METWMNCCWAHRQHPCPLHDFVGHQASVGNLCKHFFMFRSWSICLDERSDYLWFMCTWWKLPPWTRESQCCFLWNHRKSVMHTCEVFCGLETCNLHSICVPSTPSHWLICSRRRSSFTRANHMTYARTSLSTAMVPNQNSVVFYCKTTMWSCLSETTCSHVRSRTSSCFGACYRSSFPKNLATSSRRFVLQTFIFFLDSMSLEYPVTNQIWISGRYDGWNISQEL